MTYRSSAPQPAGIPYATEKETQLTSEEFKAGRKSLGLSVYQLGHILNTTPDTVRKWEMPDYRSTARGPNPVAQRVLQWMLDGYRPPEWPSNTGNNERAAHDSD